MTRTVGFTLLELVVALAVTMILLTLGLPSFTSSSRQNCVVSGANALLNALTQARDQAVTCNCTVSICKSSDGEHCTRGGATPWTEGFLTFADTDHNGILASTEKLLAVGTPIKACASLSSNKYLNYVSFNSDGIVNSNGSFFVAAKSAPEVNRTVAIFVGRVRICSSQTDRNCPAAP